MICSHCGEDDPRTVVTGCPDPENLPETLVFAVCGNCDYGINEHTEGVCTCPGVTR